MKKQKTQESRNYHTMVNTSKLTVSWDLVFDNDYLLVYQAKFHFFWLGRLHRVYPTFPNHISVILFSNGNLFAFAMKHSPLISVISIKLPQNPYGQRPKGGEWKLFSFSRKLPFPEAGF